MIESLRLIPALSEGAVLGAFFFGGLWWTVRKGVLSPRPALLFISSLLVRTGIVLAGFYFLLGDDWQKLLAGLLGFVFARMAVIRLTRNTAQPAALVQDAGHAP